MSGDPCALDPELLRYASTARQREVVQAVIDFGGLRAASRALSLNYSAVHGHVDRVIKRAARSGYSPAADKAGIAPPGYVIKGKSTYFDSDGKVRGQWVKTAIDAEQQELFRRAAIEAMSADIKPLPPTPAPAVTDSDLLNVYTVTDYHFNMLAWGDEAGDDWDMNISADTLRRAFRIMVDGSPAATTCVIAQLGDFSHTDSFKNATPTSGHELDADSRFEKAVNAMLVALRDLIEYALTKHDKVVVLLAEGNHDMSASVWFRGAFGMLYAENPRVEIIKKALPYYAYEFGNVMLGWHHGHLAKHAALPMIFATDFAEMWGRTTHRTIHTGHLHHRDVKEYPGVEVYQHPTLAASDAYAARGGWRSKRRAIALTYHRQFGEWGMKVVTPEMLA